MGELTRVDIDFATSHLVFPTVIGCMLLVLGFAIAVIHRQNILGSGAMWRATFAEMDKPRFLGALALTIAYFSLMVPVGDIWPNTGMGFLICSIPFLLMSGLLFMRDRSLRQVVPLAIVAALAPTLVWWLFSEVFFLTLP